MESVSLQRALLGNDRVDDEISSEAAVSLEISTPMRASVPLEISDRHRAELMIIATFSTGIIDAIGYLGFDKIFTANMTGNVIVLGMGLSGADLPVIGPLIALLAFAVGAAGSGLVLRRERKGWTRLICNMFLAEALALAVVGILLLFLPPAVGSPSMYAFTFILALLLGAQAAAARKVGVQDVTTVVVTSTITSLAAESWSPETTVEQTIRRLAAVAALSIGAVFGGLLHSYAGVHGDAYGVLATAVGICIVAILGDKRLRAFQR